MAFTYRRTVTASSKTARLGKVRLSSQGLKRWQPGGSEGTAVSEQNQSLAEKRDIGGPYLRVKTRSCVPLPLNRLRAWRPDPYLCCPQAIRVRWVASWR